jgi:alpha-galactosidase
MNNSTIKNNSGLLPALLIILTITAVSCTGKRTETPLSSLDLFNMEQGWGRPHIDKSVTNKPLSIAGKQFPFGVGTHASSRIDISLQGKPARFSSWVGIDDGAARPGSVEFIIEGDSLVLWKSGLMHKGDSAKKADIRIKGVKTVSLIVTDGDDGNDYDHADWAEAVFESSAKLAAEGPREKIVEEKIILTPKPGPAPRINGARIFGVRPGSPFLYTIAATGDRPMKYDAVGLPAGLSCNPENGQISGTLGKKGEYIFKFRVTNDSGTAERNFKIVCGNTLALTPHMGWNSWYVWENHITDSIMRASADAMVKSGMMDHGYMYVNIDDCWSVKEGAKDQSLLGEPRDKNGLINSNRRFPDMKAMTGYIHSLGLKAGIYTSPGPKTCAGFVAAYKFEDKDIQRYAEWGFDFLKYDWCSYGEIAKDRSLPELQKPYLQISSIIARQERDIVLNLCQYGMGDVWKWGKSVGGNSWRTAGDLGGSFEGIGTALFRDGFDVFTTNELYKYGGPGGWNDPDYLLLGYLSNWEGETVPTPLTPNEQYTQVSLWALQAAPLIFSGDITRLDDFTLSLLTNDEIIDVDQDPLGKPGFRVAKNGETEIWKRELVDGSIATGLFNRGKAAADVAAIWSDLGISGKFVVRDLWRQTDLGTFTDKYSVKVARHGVAMIRLIPSN